MLPSVLWVKRMQKFEVQFGLYLSVNEIVCLPLHVDGYMCVYIICVYIFVCVSVCVCMCQCIFATKVW